MITICEAQRKKFVTQNKFTNKGIYFALKYFMKLKKVIGINHTAAWV